MGWRTWKIVHARSSFLLATFVKDEDCILPKGTTNLPFWVLRPSEIRKILTHEKSTLEKKLNFVGFSFFEDKYY